MKATTLKNNQVVSYLFWCIMTTAVSWITYSIFIHLIKLVIPSAPNAIVWTANILSWICAVTFSFFANKKRVFHSKSWRLSVVLPEIIKFFSTRLAVGLLEIVLVPAMISLGLNQSVFGTEGMLAKVIVTPIIILLNYCFGKFFIFNRISKK